VQHIKAKYLSIYDEFRKKGSNNKILLLLLLLIGLAYAFLEMKDGYYRFKLDEKMSYKTLILIFLIFSMCWMIMILFTNSISYLNKRKVESLKYHFKQAFINRVKTEIPEIKDYIPNQKIHPKIFNDSGLFGTGYSDYIGDDWIQGEYKNVHFEMCELHVFRLFKNIFHGMFVRCRFPYIVNNIDIIHNDNKIRNLMNNYENKYSAIIKLVVKNNNLYIAVERKDKFLRCDKAKHINYVDYDFNLLKDLVQIIKDDITEYNKTFILSIN